MNVTKIVALSSLARAIMRFRTAYRRWRADQMLPSVLYDLNRHLGEDVGIVREDVLAAIDRERTRRATARERHARRSARTSPHLLPDRG